MQRTERDVKFFLTLIGVFLLTTLVVCVPVGVLGSSNIVWGEADQYGTVPVPGAKTLHLPAGHVDVAVALAETGRGNETPVLPIPTDLSLRLTPHVPVKHDIKDTGNAMTNSTDTQRHVYDLQVPRAGDYAIVTRGSFSTIGFNAQLWFGHGPPIPGTLVPLIAAVLALIGMAGYFAVWKPRRAARA
jgi:hypothetical protein